MSWAGEIVEFFVCFVCFSFVIAVNFLLADPDCVVSDSVSKSRGVVMCFAAGCGFDVCECVVFAHVKIGNYGLFLFDC